jgi:L-asparagine transporter-like permease
MAIISDLEKLSSRNLFFYFLLITALISAGFLLIFVFCNDLFIRLDIFKSLLLSVAVTSPINILNSFLALAFASFSEDETVEDRLFSTLIVGSVFTILFLYLIIILKLFFNFDVKIAFWLFIIQETIFTIVLVYDKEREKRRNKNSNK